MLTFSISIIVLIFTHFARIAVGGSDNEVRLSGSDYTKLFDDVKAGTTYEGTTVFMESDLNLASGDYYSISAGINTTHFFKGTLDGQGHVIKNAEVIHPPVYQYAGLFGYSTGMTIRNVVIDSSCSISTVTTYNGIRYLFNKDTHIGWLMGRCESIERPCIIENVVNMGGISFGHTIDAELYLSGIVGSLYSVNHESIVRNCANYGAVSSPETANTLYIGGIVGYSSGNSEIRIQNCLNYGDLTRKTTKNGYVGGIVGNSTCVEIKNCVSGGKISSSTTTSGAIGNIVGHVVSDTKVTHSFWTSDTGYNNAYGDGSSCTLSDSSLITLSTETVSELNNYAETNSKTNNVTWNKWLFNAKGKSVTFYINSTKNYITLSSQIILSPSTKLPGYSFIWYTNSDKSTKFSSMSITDDISLYGGVQPNSYTVTFDGNEGTVSGESTRTVTYGQQYGVLPEVTRTGYTLSGWSTDLYGGTMVNSTTTVTIAMDHTLYAQWTKNNYTVTFDFGNGTMINESFPYNSEIQYPENSSVVRERYTFNGWDHKFDFMPSYNFTTTAQWTKNNYTVTFDFGNGTMMNESFSYNSEIQYPEETTIMREGHTFNGWVPKHDLMPDHNFTTTAQWIKNNYTVTFDFGNGTMINESFPYNSKIQCPEETTIIKEGFTFDWWVPKYVFMPAYNFTTTAQWIKNIYTVTFDFGNGTMTNESFLYNSEIHYPENNTIMREGFTFDGWIPKYVFMPSYNFTTTANWTENPKEIPKEEESSSSVAPTLIKITFGSINFNEEEIISIVSNYTDAEFTIVKFETDEKTGELTVIIKFTDKEQAESFVEVINNSSTNDVIKNAIFITDNIKSFSPALEPFLLFIV